MKTKSGHGLQLGNCLDSISPVIERVVLAFSGGIDSCVLLHLLTSKPRPYKIQLWHINHGLQVIADEMETFCRSVAGLYKQKIEVSHLNLDAETTNLEAEARKARYALFEQALTPVDCLLTAHHADDQAETFILNILRGSGSAGLRGIAKGRSIGRSTLFRPLLDISRTDILTYARQNQLEWFDDPSNLSVRFNRNYLRHQVLPLLKNRWPGFTKSIRSVIAIQAETQEMLDDLGAQDYLHVRRRDQLGKSDVLCRKGLLELSLSRQKNLIRYWLNKYDHTSLPQNRLNELIRQLQSSMDSMPVVSGGGYEIRSYNRCLYIVNQDSLVPLQDTYDFKKLARLKISCINLVLGRESIFHHLKLKDSGQSIKFKFRLNSSDSNPDVHRLKRLFQKHKIPPWKRSLTPQIYLDDELTGLWF